MKVIVPKLSKIKSIDIKLEEKQNYLLETKELLASAKDDVKLYLKDLKKVKLQITKLKQQIKKK